MQRIKSPGSAVLPFPIPPFQRYYFVMPLDIGSEAWQHYIRLFNCLKTISLAISLITRSQNWIKHYTAIKLIHCDTNEMSCAASCKSNLNTHCWGLNQWSVQLLFLEGIVLIAARWFPLMWADFLPWAFCGQVFTSCRWDGKPVVKCIFTAGGQVYY